MVDDHPTRRLLHKRTIVCDGYQRDDGLWEIEAHLTDVKTYTFNNRWRGDIHPDEPLHDMTLRLTVDDNLTITAVFAETRKAPFPVCPAITPAFQKLVGLTISPGWRKQVKAMLGGIQGCTHLVELLTPLATTAFQTIFPYKSREMVDKDAKADTRRPPLLNTCHAFAANSPVVEALWPNWYRPDESSEPENGKK